MAPSVKEYRIIDEFAKDSWLASEESVIHLAKSFAERINKESSDTTEETNPRNLDEAIKILEACSIYVSKEGES